MAKFNEVQKQKRAAIVERKRAIHGDPLTKKLKNKRELLSISGKRKRKLLKKQRREQKEKEALALAMAMPMPMQDDDVGMADSSSHPTKLNVKKTKPLKLRRLKNLQGRGKKSKSSVPTAQPDSMIE